MHWTVDAPSTDTTLPETWPTLTHNLTAYVRRHGTAQAQRWISWPTDTERTLELRTASLQEHANQLRGMHRPKEGQGPAYSIFRRDAPRPAPKLAPEQPQPKRRPRPGGADPSARWGKRPKPEPKVAPAPPPPDQQPKPKTPACPPFTPAERAAMHSEWLDGTEVQGVYGATLRGQPKQFVWFRGMIQGRMATPGQHGNLQWKIKWQALPEWGKKVETSNLELWDDRQFPECPVQLCTPANQVVGVHLGFTFMGYGHSLDPRGVVLVSCPGEDEGYVGADCPGFESLFLPYHGVRVAFRHDRHVL